MRRQGDRTPKPCPHGGRHKHGTKVCYQRDVCRCDPCTDAASLYDIRRRRQIAYGRWTPRPSIVDGTEARLHIQKLRANGLGLERISRLAGLSHHPIRTLARSDPNQPSPRIEASSARAILAIPLDAEGSDGTHVDATGTRRRIQALAFNGWSLERQAKEAGFAGGSDTVWEMLTQPTVLTSSARQYREAYDRIWDREPPCRTSHERGVVTRTKRWAARKGWAPPLAWDDDEIDDPAAKPSGVRRGSAA